MTFPNKAFWKMRPLQIALLTVGLLAAGGGYPLPAQTSSAAPPSSTATLALPSGLAAVSQLMVEGSQLALDSDGNLFRTENQGKRWRQVHQQWAGKAVELLGIPPLTAAPGSGQAAKTEVDPPIYAAVLLRSSSALHWVSVDRGKTWKPSTLDEQRRSDVKWSGN